MVVMEERGGGGGEGSLQVASLGGVGRKFRGSGAGNDRTVQKKDLFIVARYECCRFRAMAFTIVKDTLSNLPEELRELVQTLLLDRFASTGVNVSHNTRLVRTLCCCSASTSSGLHCHRSGRLLPVVELRRYRCIVGILEGKCVGVACVRHVPPPRRAPSSRAFSELLLLATDRGYAQ